MEQAKECISVFCKAQAQLNTIDKKNDSQRKVVQERIKTCRSMLTDELSKQGISCLEVNLEGQNEPVFLRMKPKQVNINMSHSEVIDIIESGRCDVGLLAEKYGYDLPNMLVGLVHNYVKEKQQNNTTMCTLNITSSRERGFSKESGTVSNEYMNIAKELLSARRDFCEMQKVTKTQKRPALEEQKRVSDEVKKALVKHDPDKMTQKVHMTQNDGNWLYYLRCKEKKIKPNFGIRKVTPIVETAACKALENLGLSRDFMPTTPLPAEFWSNLTDLIENKFKEIETDVKVSSTLTLDRGASKR